MTRVAVTGAAGRMGKTLVRAIHEAEDLTLGVAVEHPESPDVGTDAGELAGVGTNGILILGDLGDAIDDFDVVIDFTVPKATLGIARVCAPAGKAMVVGTTGFTDAELTDLHKQAETIPLFMAPNMSVGVNLVFKLIQMAAEVLDDSVDVEVVELHHRHKIDAPSGTAVRMGEVLAETLDRDLETDAIYGREGIIGARDRQTIGFSSLRGGDIVGEHTVMFAGEGERIEITHRAQSRMNFAQGALRAVRYVSNHEPGVYDMQTILGLK